MTGTVTVVMAFYQTPETIRLAVDSILAQTYTDLRVLVMNDGDDPSRAWEPLADITDPRMVRFDLPEHRGRYYADYVALAACDTPWFHPHDSDDYSDPTRVERMVAAAEATGAEYVVAGMTIHEDGTVKPYMPPVTKVKHKQGRNVWAQANYGTLWATDALRAIGGPHPDFYFAYDAMLATLALTRLRWTVLWDHGYHYVRRPGSLTTSEETGIAAPARKQAWERREAIWAQIAHAPTSDLPDHPALAPAPDTAEALRRDVEALCQLDGSAEPLAVPA